MTLIVQQQCQQLKHIQSINVNWSIDRKLICAQSYDSACH